ncbi:MAG: hypothetical protein AAF546_08590 [Verrucomicrobiota bacterium]
MTESNEESSKQQNAIMSIKYSLRELMEEVVEERRDSVLGRELVDAAEIEKMFSRREHKKKKS